MYKNYISKMSSGYPRSKEKFSMPLHVRLIYQVRNANALQTYIIENSKVSRNIQIYTKEFRILGTQ